MDANRFDVLSRSFFASPSRRTALRLLIGSALGTVIGHRGEESAAHNALKTCRKKSGKQKKKCLKKARAHNATHRSDGPQTAPPPACVPDCTGKTCGDDGCGGTCGPCTDGTCTDGTCTCAGGMEVCQSRCVSPCSGTNQERNPATCDCCERRGSFCDSVGDDPACCSRICEDVGAVGGPACGARSLGTACDFAAQCASDICSAGACSCPTGQEPCQGSCRQQCGSGRIMNPVSCGCCIPNGASCAGAPSSCCAGTNRCTGAGTTCAGLPASANCQFDAQCANTNCSSNVCGGVNG